MKYGSLRHIEITNMQISYFILFIYFITLPLEGGFPMVPMVSGHQSVRLYCINEVWKFEAHWDNKYANFIFYIIYLFYNIAIGRGVENYWGLSQSFLRLITLYFLGYWLSFLSLDQLTWEEEHSSVFIADMAEDTCYTRHRHPFPRRETLSI